MKKVLSLLLVMGVLLSLAVPFTTLADATIAELENTPVQYGDHNGDGNTSASDAL